MKTQISIEEIQEITRRRHKINKLNLEDIEWTENGKIINIPPQVISEFDFCGLSNIDFITTGYYKKDITRKW